MPLPPGNADRSPETLAARTGQTDGIGDAGDHPIPKGGIVYSRGRSNRSAAGFPGEPRTPLNKKCLQPGSPAVAPQVLEGKDDARGGECRRLGGTRASGFEADRVVHVGDIEVADLVGCDGVVWRRVWPRPSRREGRSRRRPLRPQLSAMARLKTRRCSCLSRLPTM